MAIFVKWNKEWTTKFISFVELKTMETIFKVESESDQWKIPRGLHMQLRLGLIAMYLSLNIFWSNLGHGESYIWTSLKALISKLENLNTYLIAWCYKTKMELLDV